MIISTHDSNGVMESLFFSFSHYFISFIFSSFKLKEPVPLVFASMEEHVLMDPTQTVYMDLHAFVKKITTAFFARKASLKL